MQFNPVTIALIAAAAAYFIVEQLMRSTRLNKFALLLRDGRCDEALELLDKPSSKWLYPPFNREYMKLNAYLVKDDVEGASRQFDVLLTMRSSKNQRSEVVVKAYRFYMEHERYKDAKPLLDEIEKTADKGVAKESRLMWEIFAENDSSHITEMEQQFKEAKSPQQRMRLALLIATQYENAHKKSKVAEWRDKANTAASELQDMVRRSSEKK
ncbi:hypothetical protein AUL39_07955 [Tractidigestivibacter scatoligenes]|jgi:hypothetical protein|uniref:Tetratricopeptide repeat protein n=1 Tax=Tractidigestivibacter scatoligenes TaxID=1299998 RepID=A0A100YUX2_TRASO|nr:hypothetical protein [Tractidigestivibacter scatoligenes]KUH58140.1 hypothetical protein AUL39_07955 [Tractidigestivibacter scatoligenes]